MNSEDLALLLGLVGGGFGGYFGGKRRDERERAQKKEDREDDRAFAAQLLQDKLDFDKKAADEAKAEAEQLDADTLTFGDFFIDPFTKGIKYETISDYLPDFVRGKGANVGPLSAESITNSPMYFGDFVPNLYSGINNLLPFNQGGRVGLGVGGDPVDMEELIRLLEIDFDDAEGPNIGSGSSDAMRDAGFEVIRKIFKD